MQDLEQLEIPVKPSTSAPATFVGPPQLKSTPAFLSRMEPETETAALPSPKTLGVQSNPIGAGSLVIGYGTSFSGQASACKRLLVHGNAEVKLDTCEELEVAETGFLKGQVSVENAEVRGRFEGDLLVRKRLLIRAGGQVYGTMTYGEIEIERGARFGGTVNNARKEAGNH